MIWWTYFDGLYRKNLSQWSIIHENLVFVWPHWFLNINDQQNQETEKVVLCIYVLYV